MTTPDTQAARKPSAELLALAEQCGGVIGGNPDGSEPVNVVFSIEAWRAFAAAIQSGGAGEADRFRSVLMDIKYKAVSLADAQVIALRSLNGFNSDHPRAAPTPADPAKTEAKSITDEMMDLADRLASEADAVDPRAWGHLLVYAPREPIGYISQETFANLQDPEWRAKRNEPAMLWTANEPPSRAIVPVYATPPTPEAEPAQQHSWEEEQARFFGVSVEEIPPAEPAKTEAEVFNAAWEAIKAPEFASVREKLSVAELRAIFAMTHRVFSYHDAYRGAMDEMYLWKRRALSTPPTGVEGVSEERLHTWIVNLGLWNKRKAVHRLLELLATPSAEKQAAPSGEDNHG